MNRKENRWRHGDGYYPGASGRGREQEFDGVDYVHEGGSFMSFGDEARWKSDRDFRHYNQDEFGFNNQKRSWYKHTNATDVKSHIGKGPIGFERSDETIYDEVCQVLSDHPAIDASEVEVTVQEGLVTLTGTIESKHQKLEAEWTIDQIPGVVDIINLLRTVGEPRVEETEEEGALQANPVLRREELPPSLSQSM